VVAFSVGEEELAGIDTKPLVGHLAAWNYFESIKTPANEKFIKEWQAYTKNPKRTTNDPMEATYIGFNMWVKAVEKAKTTNADKVIDALPGTKTANLTGGVAEVLPNHHITKPVFIGEIKGNGQFDVVWKTPGLVAGDAWSKELPDSKDLIGDWVNKSAATTIPRLTSAAVRAPDSAKAKPNPEGGDTRRLHLLLPGSSSACHCLQTLPRAPVRIAAAFHDGAARRCRAVRGRGQQIRQRRLFRHRGCRSGACDQR